MIERETGGPAIKLEYCCQCAEATGRAGAADDSLYTENDGPFCESCYPTYKTDEMEQNIMNKQNQFSKLQNENFKQSSRLSGFV